MKDYKEATRGCGHQGSCLGTLLLLKYDVCRGSLSCGQEHRPSVSGAHLSFTIGVSMCVSMGVGVCVSVCVSVCIRVCSFPDLRL